MRRSDRRRRSRDAIGRRRLEVEPTGAEDRFEMGWVEWGGELIWAVGFTAGGAPFGLSASEFDVAGLEGMGAEDVPLSNSGSWIDDSNDRLRDGDGE